jgi:hypothetical protein
MTNILAHILPDASHLPDGFEIATSSDPAEAQAKLAVLQDFHLWNDFQGACHAYFSDTMPKEIKYSFQMSRGAARYDTTIFKMQSALADYMKGFRFAREMFGDSSRFLLDLKQLTPDDLGHEFQCNDEDGDEITYHVAAATKSGKITLAPGFSKIDKCWRCNRDKSSTHHRRNCY